MLLFEEVKFRLENSPEASVLNALHLNNIGLGESQLNGSLDVNELLRLPVELLDDAELFLVALYLVYVLPVGRHYNADPALEGIVGIVKSCPQFAKGAIFERAFASTVLFNEIGVSGLELVELLLFLCREDFLLLHLLHLLALTA